MTLIIWKIILCQVVSVITKDPDTSTEKPEPWNETNEAGIPGDPGWLADDSPPPPVTSQGPHSSKPVIDLEELTEIAHLGDIKLAMGFIQALQVVSLDDEHKMLSWTSPESPNSTHCLDLSDPDFCLAWIYFLHKWNLPKKPMHQCMRPLYVITLRITYLLMIRWSAISLKSQGLCWLSMTCVQTAGLAFTGPLADNVTCHECGNPHFSDKNQPTPAQEFYIIPIGPQLQALWANANSAHNLSYQWWKMNEILHERERNGGVVPCFEDFIHGSEYLEHVRNGHIRETDMVLMLSLDGAQLYEHKTSDCWIYIWVVFDHDPSGRYIKKHVLPGGFILGPNKPKLVNSFLFLGLHHLAALQWEGLQIWDASRNITFTSKPFLALTTADGPGMTYLNGLVGHQGKNGCCLYCSLMRWRKPGGSTYYPALLKPHNFAVDGCDHEDISYANLPSCSKNEYIQNLCYLGASPNNAQYKNHHLATGITKPTIFLGLQPERILGIPGCFGSDIMHLSVLNLPDLLINLWHGTFDCDNTDNCSTWEWAALKGITWTQHGQQVAAATPYLPGSFDCPPRNPAEKISSGYKAWEFLLYLYGLGLGLFYNVLLLQLLQACLWHVDHQPASYWCEHPGKSPWGISGICLWIYYQHRADCLHFVQQSVHAVTHLAPEVLKIGPPGYSSQ